MRPSAEELSLMMHTIPSASNAKIFEELISRLSARDVVEGLVVMGSVTRDEVTPASD